MYRYRLFFKPILDKLLSLFLLILLSPLLITITTGLYFSNHKQILFKQVRPGKNGKLFTVYKFKTMNDECDRNGNLLPDELRLNGLGRIIRSLSLDELPQFINVLKGDMSLIGPRPLLIEYLSLYNEEQKLRHNVKPGITGWAQVNGRNAISWKDKLDYDIWYARNISFKLDIKIFFMTLKKVFKREGISREGHATTPKFTGNF